MNKLLIKKMNKNAKIETSSKCSFNHETQLKDVKYYNKAQNAKQDSEANHIREDEVKLKKTTKYKKIEINGEDHSKDEVKLKKTTKCKKIEINGEEHFKDEIKSNINSLKVIKFYRDGCPHCSNLGSKVYDYVDARKDYNHNKIKFLDVGVKEKNIEIFKQFKIEGVPTTVFLRMKKAEILILGKVVGSEIQDVLTGLNECLKINS